MPESLGSGIALVFLAGLFQGAFLLPAKWLKNWAWENYWLIFAFMAYLVCPWIIAMATIPRLGEVLQGIAPSQLAVSMLFGLGWGIGAVTFGLGVDAIGLSLGFAIILGIATTSGTLVPLLVFRESVPSQSAFLLTLAGLAVMLAGVGVCSFAGKWKETASSTSVRGGSYRRGVLTCVASGFLSACGNLGFVFGADISARAHEFGTPEHLSANILWALLTLPLFVCNATYSLYLLRRNGTARLYGEGAGVRSYVLAASMGVMWMAGIMLYGIGARTLGNLGGSLGWAMLMASMVLVSNALGLLTGEWREAPASAKNQLAVGIAILLLAILILGYANYLKPA
jgi:L-rhamnose-H+ transport protein